MTGCHRWVPPMVRQVSCPPAIRGSVFMTERGQFLVTLDTQEEGDRLKLVVRSWPGSG